LRWDVHLTEVKYCDDTQPEQQLARTTEQHTKLKKRPCTAMPQSKPAYHPDWSDGDHL